MRGALGGLATGVLIAAFVRLVGVTPALWTALAISVLVIVAGAVRHVQSHDQKGHRR